MSILASATESISVRSEAAIIGSLVLAGLIIVMLVGQLFTFEKFPDVIQATGIISTKEGASIMAATVCVIELAALPFLLRMRLSPLARITSMVAGWIMIALWVMYSIYANAALVISNSGVLGDTVTLPVGVWMITFFLTLGVLCAWSSYAMWPFSVSKK